MRETHGKSKFKQMKHVAVEIYPQTDLFNLAHYHLQSIEDKEQSGIDDGLAMDCMACLLALGVTVEAIIEQAGREVVQNWEDFEKYDDKFRALCEKLGIEINLGVAPFQSLQEVRKARNAMAHAKPESGVKRVGSGRTVSSVLETKWDKYANPQKARQIFRDVDAFEKLVYGAMGLEYPPATSASGWVDSIS